MLLVGRDPSTSGRFTTHTVDISPFHQPDIVGDSGQRFDPIERDRAVGQALLEIGTVLDAAHRAHQGLGSIASDIEATRHPFGERSRAVAGGDLGNIELGEILNLQLPQPVDRPLRGDQPLLPLINRGGLSHVMNIRRGWDKLGTTSGVRQGFFVDPQPTISIRVGDAVRPRQESRTRLLDPCPPPCSPR